MESGFEESRADSGRDLKVDSISLRDFRNFREFSMRGIGPLTILVGPNAVGKTSVVEAIQMMTALRSFRTNQYSQMIRWGSPAAYVDAGLSGAGRMLDMSLSLREGKRCYSLNGKTKRVQDLKGQLPAVSFSPDDLNLVKGPDSNRREAVDALGAQLSKNFYAVKSDYAKLIRQRNRALKDGAPDAYIESIDDVLVLVAAQLVSYRIHIIGEMQPAFGDYYRDIAGGAESLGVRYIPSWLPDAGAGNVLSDSFEFDKQECARALQRSLAARRGEERARGKTVVGPHADKLAFMLDGRDALHYSSQGQQRSIVLAFKLAEAAVIDRTLDQRPVLLLDDVLSELDEARRRYFMGFISNDLQTFITTTNAECLDCEVREQARIVDLEQEGVCEDEAFRYLR
ncbi:MAG: DNA replication/repair protein RecF [Eggerthellaceae bacterium]